MSQTGFGRGWILAAVVAAAVGVGSAWMLAQSPRGLSQYERLGAEIGCQCGTCPLRPILTCGCGFAAGMLDELHTLVDEGHDDGAIMTTFAARYDESIRIKPASSGLDLAAWAAPMLLLTVGAVVVAAVLSRMARPEAATVELTASPAGATEADPSEAAEGAEQSRLREIVDRELSDLGD